MTEFRAGIAALLEQVKQFKRDEFVPVGRMEWTAETSKRVERKFSKVLSKLEDVAEKWQ